MKKTLLCFYGFLLDIFFPRLCQGCGQEGSYLCLSCQGQLKTPPQRCLVCGKPALLGKIHPECQNRKTHLAGLLVAADYHKKSVQSLIWNLKYQSASDITETLSLLLTDFLVSQDLLDYFAAGLVIPVPLHKKRLRLRGFNQADLLARHLASKLGLEFRAILKKTRNTPRQVDLSRAERQQNVENSYFAPEHSSLRERKILLIDDVATTGATLNECARVLKERGASEIWALVVARN